MGWQGAASYDCEGAHALGAPDKLLIFVIPRRLQPPGNRAFGLFSPASLAKELANEVPQRLSRTVMRFLCGTSKGVPLQRAYVMPAIFDTFKLRAEAVSAEVHRFPQKTEALDFIVEYLQLAGVTDSPQFYAVWADCPFLNGVDKAANRRTDSRPELRRHSREGCRFEGRHQPTRLGHGQHRLADSGCGTGRPPAGVDASQHSHRHHSDQTGCCPICHLFWAKSGRNKPTTSPLSPGLAAPPILNACSPSACMVRKNSSLFS